MAKKIVWSENAIQDRLQILNYWYQRIGNKKYSNYLDACFKETVLLISEFPQNGLKIKIIFYPPNQRHLRSIFLYLV